MTAKLTRLTHKMAIQLHLVAESCSSSSRSGWPVRKFLDTPSYIAGIRKVRNVHKNIVEKFEVKKPLGVQASK